MFTDSVKFFKNTKLEEAYKTVYGDSACQKYSPSWKDFAKLIEVETKNWGIEYEKKVEMSDISGTIFLHDLLGLAQLKCADILYDFRGNISILDMVVDTDIKIEENTFTRSSPLYRCCIIYNNVKFKIQGDVSFKATILNDETRKNIIRANFHTVLNKDYILRYGGGGIAIDINVSSEAEKEKKFLYLINQE